MTKYRIDVMPSGFVDLYEEVPGASVHIRTFVDEQSAKAYVNLRDRYKQRLHEEPKRNRPVMSYLYPEEFYVP